MNQKMVDTCIFDCIYPALKGRDPINIDKDLKSARHKETAKNFIIYKVADDVNSMLELWNEVKYNN